MLKSSLFSLFSVVYTINTDLYLVTVRSDLKPSFIDKLDFYRNENVWSIFNIGDVNGYVMYYDEFPSHLYLYDFIDLVEADQYVKLQMPQQFVTYNSYDTDPQTNVPKTKGTFNLQLNPGWNLDRVDQRMNALDSKFYYPTTSGANTNVFVVDTGIDITHPEFEGRAQWGFNGVDSNNKDCNGHGTHVAGTVGSKTYGISKKANLIAVKVLNCDGGGSYSGIIAGLEYVIKTHKQSGKPSIINMSLGGPKSNVLEAVLNELYTAGIHVVVAAGNENADACNSSPSNSNKVMTVGATTKNAEMASFSNWGSCVNVLSPGTEILSTFPDGKTSILQGTSMASPLVAGVMSLLLSDNPTFKPKTLFDLITTRCSKNYITKIKGNTANCLVYSQS